jgi:hypothetical protein
MAMAAIRNAQNPLLIFFINVLPSAGIRDIGEKPALLPRRDLSL